MNEKDIPFTCPECGSHKIIETMANVVVHSEISITDGVVQYGDQTNEDGYVEMYQCDCGYVIVDDASPHADDGLDVAALAKALKALNEPEPKEPEEPKEGDPFGYAYMLGKMNEAFNGLSGEDMAAEWTRMFPGFPVKYLGDSLFEWEK